MAHPYSQHKNAQKSRVKQIMGHAKGGAVHKDEAQDRKLIKSMLKSDSKAHGDKGKGRMDKYARGGKIKHGGKGHHTKINIVVAPKAGGDMPPAGPMGGPPPPPMPPKAPMGPPPGGPMGGGMPPPPGAGGMPGMKRGGKVKSGLSTKENIKAWSDRASSNTRYERGGGIKMKAGADSGEGRLEKSRKYNAKKG